MKLGIKYKFKQDYIYIHVEIEDILGAGTMDDTLFFSRMFLVWNL